MFSSIIASIITVVAKVVAFAVKAVVTYGVKAFLVARHVIKVTATFAATVAIKAGAPAAVAKAVEGVVKLSIYAAANYGTQKLIAKAPTAVREPLSKITNIALLALVA